MANNRQRGGSYGSYDDDDFGSRYFERGEYRNDRGYDSGRNDTSSTLGNYVSSSDYDDYSPRRGDYYGRDYSQGSESYTQGRRGGHTNYGGGYWIRRGYSGSGAGRGQGQGYYTLNNNYYRGRHRSSAPRGRGYYDRNHAIDDYSADSNFGTGRVRGYDDFYSRG